MMKLIMLTLLVTVALDVQAVSYRANGSPEILQMHREGSWEKVCETANNNCDVPAGTYHVSILDRNWNLIERRSGVRVSETTDSLLMNEGQLPQQSGDNLPPIGGQIVQYHRVDTWEKVCETSEAILLKDCVLPTGAYQISTFDKNWNKLGQRISFVMAEDIQPVVPEQEQAIQNTSTDVPVDDATSVDDNTIFVADYENGADDSGVAGLQALSPAASSAITVSSEYSRSGQYSINHRVRKNDDYISAGAWRSESNSMGLRKSRYDQGDTIRYQFSIFLPPSWEIDDEKSVGIIWQWKRFSSRPDMFVLIRGGDIELRALTSSRVTVLKDYRVGEWIDLQFDVVHSARSDGSVRMSYKYASETTYKLGNEYSGATMLSDGPVDSTYLKWGLYKPDFDQSSFPYSERSIYHDDIRVQKLR